jgi:hypothetical protein
MREGRPVIEIPLTQGKVAIVDECDAHLAAFRWHACRDGRTWYAKRAKWADGRSRTVILHREILGVPRGVQVDHVNGNGLDCRRANMRPATGAENTRNYRTPSHNTSGYKGIIRRKNGRWQACIRYCGKRTYLGRFGSAEEAARAYDAAALRLHGEFARINFPHSEAA